MSNEKKMNEKEMILSTEGAAEIRNGEETTVENVAIVEGDAIFTGLYLERELYQRNGEQRFYCYVKGLLRGREVIAGMTPKDFGGYDVLDLVFGDAEKVMLYKVPYEMRDERTKKVTRGYTYKAVSVDEDGTVYSITVKPARDSDKALLEMLVKLMEREAAKK